MLCSSSAAGRPQIDSWHTSAGTNCVRGSFKSPRARLHLPSHHPFHCVHRLSIADVSEAMRVAVWPHQDSGGAADAALVSGPDPRPPLAGLTRALLPADAAADLPT